MVKQNYKSSYGIIKLVDNHQQWVPLWWFMTYSTLKTNKKNLGSKFKLQLQLAEQVACFMHQLPLHPKMKISLIHKISTSAQSHNKKASLYCIIFCSKLQTSSMPMKFQNINPMTTLSTLTNVHSPWSRFLLWILIQLLAIEKHNKTRHRNMRDHQIKRASCLCHPPHAHKLILHTLTTQQTRA